MLNKLIHKLINKIFLQNLGNQFFWNPPYDYVQNITVNNVFNYLNLRRKDIKNWCIVGVHLGREINPILKKYPNVKIDGFECSKRYIKKLRNKFDKNSRVQIINKAVSNEEGIFNFYETSLHGNGSLLKLGELSKKSYGSKQQETFLVETTTLDNFYKNKNIDILWIDVQGAEKLVIEGSLNTLKKIKAIFIEISVNDDLYNNSTNMDELNNLLVKNGFKLILLGTDFNLTGNALYIK